VTAGYKHVPVAILGARSASYDAYRDLAQALASDRLVIVVDPAWAASAAPAELVLALRDVVKARGFTVVDLVAEDEGIDVALRAAPTEPKFLRRLLLLRAAADKTAALSRARFKTLVTDIRSLNPEQIGVTVVALRSELDPCHCQKP
jgi:hypothetical protein